MARNSHLKIVNTKRVRGVLAPASKLSKKLLEDVIDFIELSSPASTRQSARRIRQANKEKSWIPLKDVLKRAKRSR